MTKQQTNETFKLNFKCPHKNETVFIDNTSKKIINRKCRQMIKGKVFLCDYCKGHSDGQRNERELAMKDELKFLMNFVGSKYVYNKGFKTKCNCPICRRIKYLQKSLIQLKKYKAGIK